ncbi:hypothetical protein CDL12_18037 [Handroanthus impetiginosus]|uniref:Uncharacterized protein n=1 Tax=Handroanthus impetiginosus TaxID=429701 RepID=A0A2G9GVS5_9LAMI|nr:hypothetical protein CDL12_18037 [Handroanthus impetiginosus]
MAAGGANTMFRCVFDASLSMCDTDIERRPYHYNCKCALHKQKGKCSSIGSRQRNVSFPKREFKDKCCSVSVSASTVSARSSYVRSYIFIFSRFLKFERNRIYSNNI